MTNDEIEKIYNECYQKLFMDAKVILKNEADANDVVQEAFVELCKYDKPIKYPYAWLRRVVENKCNDHFDKSYTQKTDLVEEFFDDIEIVPEDNNPIEVAVSDETDRIFMDILENSLSDDVRRTLIMASFDDMSTKEIAETLGIPQGTVSSRINAAKNKLRVEVRKYEEKHKTKLYSVSLPMLAQLLARQAMKVPLRPMSASLTAALSASAEAASATAATTAATTAAAGAAKAAGGILIKQVVIISASVLIVGTAAGGTLFYFTHKSVTQQTETTVEEIEETTEETTTETTVQIEVDPFDYIDVSFDGTAPYGTASVSVSDDCPVDLNVVLSSASDLNNGDVVTVTAECGTEGYVLSNESQEYTVSGLTRDVEVYTAESYETFDDYAYEYLTVTIPGINLSGLDTTDLNSKIKEVINTNGGWAYSYSYYFNDKFVSLFIDGQWLVDDGSTDFTVFNIDIETGQIMSKEEFLAMYGMSKEDFDACVTTMLTVYMDNHGGYDWSVYDSDMTYKDLNLSPDRIDAAVPYVSDKGNLCFVSYVTFLDWSYDYAFDTVTNEVFRDNDAWEAFG